MDNSESDKNPWSGKSAENVLAISLHELRNPIARLTGYLELLQSAELSEEQSQKLIGLALDCSLSAQEVVDNISQYLRNKN
jgi:signal transduction histidine kinase